MNRFIAKIVFVGLLAAQFAPAAAFAQPRPQARPQPLPAQITSVVVLRALLKAASDAPAFTRARRSGPKDTVDVFLREKGVSASDLPRFREEAARGVARDIAQALHSPSVINMLRAEKDGMLGAAETVSSASFAAQVVTKSFAPKPAPAKRVSVLPGVIAVAQAGDVPTDAEIAAAEKNARSARDEVRDARAEGLEKGELEKLRAVYEKFNADLAKLKLKKSIAESVAKCKFDPENYYGDVKRSVAQAIVDELLTRFGGLIKNPYLPEHKRFQTPIEKLFKIGGGPEPSSETWDAIRSGTKDGGELYEAWITLEFVYALQLFPSDKNKTFSLRELFERTLEERTSFPRTIRSEFEKQGILNMGGLADAIDEFLSIQRVLLFEDIADLQKKLCDARKGIKDEIEKLKAAVQAMKDQLNKDRIKEGKPEIKLGDVADPKAEQAFNAALQIHLTDCSTLESPDNLILLLKQQIYSKIFDAIKNAISDMVKGGQPVFFTAFPDAVRGDNEAVKDLQKAADEAAKAEYPGLFEGLFEGLPEELSRRLTIRFGIFLLRNLRGYDSDLNMLLMSGLRKTKFDFDNTVGFNKAWGIISDNPKLVQLQKLLFAIDEFVRRVKEILAGKEGMSATALKVEYCSAKTRIERDEKKKEDAMKKIEQKGEVVRIGGGGGACSNPGGVFCQRSQVSGEYENCAVNPVGLVCNLGTGARYYEPEPNASCACTYLCIDSPPPPDNPADFQNGPNLYAAQGSGCANPGTWEQQ